MRETFESNMEDFEDGAKQDSKTYVKFYIRPVHDEEKSAEEGRPIYHDAEYIEIRTPGNETNIVRRPVSEIEKRRFAAQYRAFKAGEIEQNTGTPLSEVPWITRSQVEELSYLRISTIEILAEVNDDVCTRIPGLFKLKQRAQVYVQQAKEAAPNLKLQKENEDMKNRLDSLEATVQAQTDLIASLKAQTKAAGKTQT
jgi:hypothetical protein